jgi:hypothetical protein
MHAYVCVFVCVYIYRDMEREDGGRHFFLFFSPIFPPTQRQRGGGGEKGEGTYAELRHRAGGEPSHKLRAKPFFFLRQPLSRQCLYIRTSKASICTFVLAKQAFVLL